MQISSLGSEQNKGENKMYHTEEKQKPKQH